VEHVAIDLGATASQVCVRSERGEVLEERRMETNRLSGWLQKRPTARVVMESCAEAFAVADGAKAAGHEVRVVPSTLSKTLGVGRRGVKNDVKDARVLSEASCALAELPSVHVPTEWTRHLKAMLKARKSLVDARTQLINSVRGYLRTKLVTLRKGNTKGFPEAVRKRLAMAPEGLPRFIEAELDIIATLTEKIKQADTELTEVAKAHAVCTRLMTVPGTGALTALAFVAAIEDVGRFRHAHAVEAYLGLVPGERSSGEKERRTGITKAGTGSCRTLLVQAAWCFWRHRKQHPAVQWTERVASRRGRFIAIVALARKLAGILFALWRDGTSYDPTYLETRSVMT
jgi:transposase